MTFFRRQLLLNALKLFDAAVMAGSFVTATLFSREATSVTTLIHFLEMRIKIGNFILFLVLLLLWHITLSAFGLYESRRMNKRRTEIRDLLAAITIGTILIAAVTFLFSVRMVSPRFLIFFWAMAVTIGTIERLVQRLILGHIRLRGRNLRNLLIVGTNSRALAFVRRLVARPELGYRIIGFVDDEWDGLAAFKATEYQLVSDFAGLPALFRTTVVDEVLIAIPVRSFHSCAARIAELCEQQGIITGILDVFDLRTARARAEEFEGSSLIAHYTASVNGWAAFAKNAVDIIGALALLITLLPIMLVIAVLIKVTSNGPILFTQKRLGYNKRIFHIYKFRTMVADAEARIKDLEAFNEVSGPAFKMKDDPRVTPVGHFLRKTSLDELPQLINVLKREMSLVGPRPLPVRDYQGFHDDWQRRRFTVKPGLTCLWQVNGRSSVPFEQWMQLDLQYIDSWSLWLDLKILLKTLPAVLRGAGAL